MRIIIGLFSPISLTRASYVTLIICSAAVTAYFGKVMGGDFILVPAGTLILNPDLSMGVFTAVGFATVSVLAAVFAHHAGLMRAEGMKEWKLVGQFALFLLACDIFTNYISWTTIRSQKAVVATNTNTLATDARSAIKRLEERNTLLKRQIEFAEHLSSPEAYDALIAAAQLVRDNEAKRGGCGPICEQKTKELAQLQADRANALEARSAEAELKQNMALLRQAKAKAEDRQFTIDPTNTQNMELASTIAMGADPSERLQFIAAKIIGIVGAIMFSLAASACGLLLGVMEGYGRKPNEHDSWAPRAQIQASPVHTPVSLSSEPAPVSSRSSHTETVTYSYSGHDAPSAFERLRALKEYHERQAAAMRGQT